MGRPKGSKNKGSEEIVDVVAEVEENVEAVVDAEEVDAMDLADDTDTTPAAPGMRKAPSMQESFMEAMREQTSVLRDMMPPKKVLFSQFKTRSKFNPDGKRRSLSCSLYQNGYRCNVKNLTDREIELVKFLKPGVFIDKLVTVRRETGGAEEDDKVFISYSNKTQDQRMSNKDHWNGFADLLQQCVDEAAARSKRKAQRVSA